MEMIDNIENVNDLIIAIKAQLSKKENNKDLLIRECFVLWYTLVEGIECENFTEEEINELLVKNYKIYQENYLNDIDYNFIIGWMLSVAFWYFNSDLDESDGNGLLMNVYKQRSDNCLFKWAVREEIKVNQNEVNGLCNKIHDKFDSFYNYGSFIKHYFLEIINSQWEH